MLTQKFRHIDLKEVAARVDPAVQKPSARGLTYVQTLPGMADYAFAMAAFALIDLWKAAPGRPVRMADIEPAMKHGPAHDVVPRLAASLKRLDRIKQVKLDFDRDGVIVTPGSAWIET